MFIKMIPALYKKFYQLEKDNWWFRTRRKIILELLDKICEGKRREILDAGCGTGLMLNYLVKYGKVIGIDNSKEALGFCQQRGLKNVKYGDLEGLKFSNLTFDVVTILDVLEHVKDDKKALKEIFRILRSGGTILMTIPALPWLWSSHDDVNHHYRRYTKKEIETKVEKAGFILEKVTYFNSLLFIPSLFSRKGISFLNKLGFFKQHFDLAEFPPFLNNFLTQVFYLETEVMHHVDLPIGMTLLVQAKKP